MKNKKFFILFYILLFMNNAVADIYKFETENLQISIENNEIIAGKGKAISSDESLEIYADNFLYNKDKKILKSFGNGLIISKSKNLKIKFDKAEIDNFKNQIKADGNIEILDSKKNYKINTENILYNQLKNKISSKTKTILKDKIGNIYNVNNFIFDAENGILKVNNLKMVDIEKNILTTDIAYLNINSGKLFGKDLYLELDDKSFNQNNEPRFKGNSVVNDENFTTVTKGLFTTCKKTDDCPPWELSAEKIEHDKKKETVNYENAILKIYDTPVMYFPKFFHPDPSVKRKSGFLTPSLQSSNNSNDYLSLPYFFVIAENKDLTFSPRFFAENKILIQTEYREVNKNSKHIADIGFFSENNKKTKNHLFYDFFKNINFKNFEEGEIRFYTQNVSNDTYLRTNRIKSNIDFNENILENSLNVKLKSEQIDIDINSSIYENLNKKNSDRYEYIPVKINILKRLFKDDLKSGELNLNSETLLRNYNTNINQKQLYNELKFQSFTKMTNFGFVNNYQFLLKNLNSQNKNTNYKDDSNYYFSGIFQYDSSLPLIKKSQNLEKILEPKFSLRIAPEHTRNLRNSGEKIDINNIYSINRASSQSSTEGGASLTYGTLYSISNESDRKLDIEVANNLRIKKNDNLSNSNQIGEKTSNFFGKIKFEPNQFLNTEYNFSIKNNLNDLNEENLVTNFKLKNFETSFDYLNENLSSSKNSYLKNSTTLFVDDKNSFKFSTRKNKTKDLTEYYNFMYQYKNDCLAASLEYNKDFYADGDIKPSENLMFKLTIIPIGETSSPNLRN